MGSGGAGQRTIAILNSTDASGMNISGPLQQALSRMFEDTRAFRPQVVNSALPGFTPKDIDEAFKKFGSEVISFAYLEKNRISVFLFDSIRSGQFIVSTQPLATNTGTKLSQVVIETQYRRAFNTLMENYNVGKFQAMPQAQTAQNQVETGKEAEGDKLRTLYEEFNEISETPTYIGASLGMARYSASSNAASTVSVGALIGTRLTPRFRLEAGGHLFSYLLLETGFKYQFPLQTKYLSLFIGGSAAYVMTAMYTARGLDTPTLPVGGFIFGPGLGFEVPLLGASIRGEIRWLLGSANVILGTYGVVYSL